MVDPPVRGTSASPPARTAVVGDSPADLAMAGRRGPAWSIGVLTGVGGCVPTSSPLADEVLDSVADLTVG